MCLETLTLPQCQPSHPVPQVSSPNPFQAHHIQHTGSLASATAATMSADLKPAGSASAQVKVSLALSPLLGCASANALQPCCVCKDEKAARDECMLFSEGDAQESCKATIDRYRSCMAGFGFKLP